MRYLALFVFALSLANNAVAKVWTYQWDITWVLANPDGRLVRPVMGINNQWPNPLINVTMGDRLVVEVTNKLGNETTGLHWHGIFQNGSNAMDGPRGVASCPIPPGGSYTFDFTACGPGAHTVRKESTNMVQIDQPGSYWYHSHDIAQYPDGLRGPIIVQDPSGPYAGKYDAELVVTVSDWYHDQMPYLSAAYLLLASDDNGNEPEPYSALINDRQNSSLFVEPGLTYYVRLINIGAFSQFWFQIDQHPFSIIEVDGNYVDQVDVQNCFITVGQRYGLLMKTKPTAHKNYAILGSMDEAMYNELPSYTNNNVTSYLVYNKNGTLPPPLTVPADEFNVFDDFSLSSIDGEAVLGNPVQTLIMDLNFTQDFNQNTATWNDITWLEQKVPSLFTAMSAGKNAVYPEIYGVNANAQVLGYGNVIELVINNYDAGPHPIHIHGHAPQQLHRSSTEHYKPGEKLSPNPHPMRRDTWLVQPGGHSVSRFVADNPGVWFVHCHMDWHLISGLAFTLVEAPLHLQASQTIPQEAYSLCESQGRPTAGNAAGNTKNYFDLQGAVTTPNPSPSGALV